MANEKRLIDADAFVEKLQTNFKRVFTNAGKKVKPEDYYIERKTVFYEDFYKAEVDDFCLMLKCFPTVDAVEVVRCKDCKMLCRNYAHLRKHCGVTGALVEDDDFCSYGERREGE